MSILADRYAEGFFALALEKNLVEEYKKQIDFVKETFDDADILPFFKSYKVSKETKKELIENSFKDSLDKYVFNFLDLLIDKNRVIYYDEIFDKFHKLCNENLNIKEGIIETAREIDDSLIRKLETSLSKDGYLVILKPKINKSLISGFCITFDDKVIDNSMKQKINKMEEMLKRKDGVYGA